MVAVSSRYRSSSSASIKIHLLFIRINYPKQSTDSFALVLEQGSLFDSPSWLFIHGHAFSGSKAVMHSSPSWWSHPPQESSSPRSPQGDHGGLQHCSVLLLASSWAWLWWAQPWWQHSWASAMGPLVTQHCSLVLHYEDALNWLQKSAFSTQYWQSTPSLRLPSHSYLFAHTAPLSADSAL